MAELVFRRNGKDHRLIATASETSSSFFVMIWDETAGTETYGGMRYMRVLLPENEDWTRDREGWTEIDFNRA